MLLPPTAWLKPTEILSASLDGEAGNPRESGGEISDYLPAAYPLFEPGSGIVRPRGARSRQNPHRGYFPADVTPLVCWPPPQACHWQRALVTLLVCLPPLLLALLWESASDESTAVAVPVCAGFDCSIGEYGEVAIDGCGVEGAT